ncbi:MAG: c-type cytochrome, partial [Hyphomonadaceae bacterium]
MMARLGLSVFLIASFVTPVFAADAQTQRQAIEVGRNLAKSHCATCHAMGKRGQSTNPQAPRFATMAQRYQLHLFAEAFRER